MIIKAFDFATAFALTGRHNYHYPERERKIHTANNHTAEVHEISIQKGQRDRQSNSESHKSPVLPIMLCVLGASD